jgi:hypothetical protein
MHEPDDPESEFSGGQQALIEQLLEELDGRREVPE